MEKRIVPAILAGLVLGLGASAPAVAYDSNNGGKSKATWGVVDKCLYDQGGSGTKSGAKPNWTCDEVLTD